MNTLIFRTNINTHNEYLKIKTALEKKFDIEDTTIDLDDCDKVLRVITKLRSPNKIAEEVKHLNYLCEELEG